MKKKKFRMVLVSMLTVALLFSVSVTALADSGSYSGSCKNYFTCNRTWNKIEDTTLKDNNAYCCIGSQTGGNGYYRSQFTITEDDGTVHEDYENKYSGKIHEWESNWQGKCRLKIINYKYSGSRIYVGGQFSIY